jgi:hypothetical protein
MTTTEYRDLIDATWDARTSLVSAATGNEQRSEAMRLRDTVDVLKAARCQRATSRDQSRAATILATCEALLSEKQRAFKESDAALSQMAFAGEWR